MPAPKGTPVPAHEKVAPGSARAWACVKKLVVQSADKKNTHICVYVDVYPEDGPGAVPRPCGSLVTCASTGKGSTFVTTGAINHMKRAHPESDIAKAEQTKKEVKSDAVDEAVYMLANAGGSALVPYSTTPEGRAEAATAMRTSAACYVIYTNAAMQTLDSRYYRENLSTHIKFTGGNPALAPISTRDNVKEYITAEWKRKCTPALPFPSFPPL